MSTFSERQLRKGLLFRHSRLLNPNNRMPQSCKVTKLAQGVVYYRPFYGYHDDGTEWLGSPAYIARENFGSIFLMLGAESHLISHQQPAPTQP